MFTLSPFGKPKCQEVKHINHCVMFDGALHLCMKIHSHPRCRNVQVQFVTWFQPKRRMHKPNACHLALKKQKQLFNFDKKLIQKQTLENAVSCPAKPNMIQFSGQINKCPSGHRVVFQTHLKYNSYSVCVLLCIFFYSSLQRESY